MTICRVGATDTAAASWRLAWCCCCFGLLLLHALNLQRATVHAMFARAARCVSTAGYRTTTTSAAALNCCCRHTALLPPAAALLRPTATLRLIHSASPTLARGRGQASNAKRGGGGGERAEPTYTATPSSLQMQDVKVGRGERVKAGDQVAVHYAGTLTDGTLFDSSRDFNAPVDQWTKAPLTFRVGTGSVIAGWDEGIVGMKVGGQRKLIVPPELGYGSAGAGGAAATITARCQLSLSSIHAAERGVCPVPL